MERNDCLRCRNDQLFKIVDKAMQWKGLPTLCSGQLARGYNWLFKSKDNGWLAIHWEKNV